MRTVLAPTLLIVAILVFRSDAAPPLQLHFHLNDSTPSLAQVEDNGKQFNMFKDYSEHYSEDDKGYNP